MQKTKNINSNERGVLLLEIIIAIALITGAFVVLMGMGITNLNISASIQKKTQADALANEEMEAVRSFRSGTTWATNGLGTLSVSSSNPYHAVLSSGSPATWTMATGSESVNGFTRKVVFDKVSRDPTTNNIETTYNAAHDAPDTRKVTVTISWTGNTYTLVAYLTNWQQ